MGRGNRNTRISKLMSLVLRHKPEVIGIALDQNGWANVSDLIEGIRQRYDFDMSLLEEIVRTDQKQRYSFNKDKTKIRANQGHTINIDLELEEKVPPDVLWHGTGAQSIRSISQRGILPMKRQFVHLSKDIETATAVGKRHGAPYVIKIDTKAMKEDGNKFYLSDNNIWLTKEVPPKYLIYSY